MGTRPRGWWDARRCVTLGGGAEELRPPARCTDRRPCPSTSSDVDAGPDEGGGGWAASAPPTAVALRERFTPFCRTSYVYDDEQVLPLVMLYDG